MQPRYWPCIFWGFGLMLATSLAMTAFKDTRLIYLHQLINSRGVISYLILWIGWGVFCAILKAFRHKDLRSRLAAVFLLLSLLPLPVGAFGTYTGFVQIRAMYATKLAEAEGARAIAEVEQWRALVIGVAWDYTILAILATVLNVALATALWVRSGDNK